MNKLLLVIFFLSLGVFFKTNSLANIPTWKKYPYQAVGSKIRFPQDEGHHKALFNLEWWYTVIHATGVDTGHSYSILVTHFNNKFRFFTITDITDKTHISGTVRGKIIAQKGYMNVKHITKYGTDFFRSKKDSSGKLIPFEYELHTHHDKMDLKAELISVKPPLMVMDNGYMSVGSSGHSFYYSNTRLKAKGELVYNGRKEKFIGQAWLDHQWGPFFVSPVPIGKMFESYEWFCIQLNDGSDIMISNIYDRFNNLPLTKEYGGVEIIDKFGNDKHTHQKKFTRLGYWRDPISGHYMSMGWSLEVPAWKLSLTLTPDFLDQMVRFPLKGDFWEGSINVKGTINGKYVEGKSFGELIHRFKIPKINIIGINEEYQNEDDIEFSFAVENKDEGNPLKFDILLINNEREELLFSNITYKNIKISIKSLNLDILDSARIKIIGKSIDETIKGEQLSQNFIIR